MGQKTHPVGFRLQVSKDWKSTWFTENSFATELESDVKIRKYLKARLPNAGISKVFSEDHMFIPARYPGGEN